MITIPWAIIIFFLGCLAGFLFAIYIAVTTAYNHYESKINDYKKDSERVNKVMEAYNLEAEETKKAMLATLDDLQKKVANLKGS